jgi:hypothetical protein
MILALYRGVMSSLLKSLNFSRFIQPSRAFMAALFGAWMFLFGPLEPVEADFGSVVDIGFAGDFYFTEQSANNGQGFVNLLIQNTWSDSQLWLDVGAGGLVGDTATSYVKAPQMYYRWGNRDQAHVTIGRALYDWSFSDEFWELGITQPLFTWNEARPETQGLTGLFVTLPVVPAIFEMTLFGSGLFIPSQGATYDLDDGSLRSSNPWFNEPVEILNLAGEEAQLTYDVDVPKTQDVISQTSYGVLLGTPQYKRGFLLSGYYLNKPRNELVLPFQGFLNLSNFNGDITVLPQVARHQTAGLDVGWNFENSKTVISWIYEGGVEFDQPLDSTYPVLPDQNILSVVQLFRLSNAHKVWLGYVKAFREDTGVGGVFATSDISTFLRRNRFDEALRLKWSGLLFKKKSQYRINASLAYNQSLANDNIWISSDLRWALSPGFEVFKQCDLFGGSEEALLNSDFMSTFQNNDRCLIGAHYAF